MSVFTLKAPTGPFGPCTKSGTGLDLAFTRGATTQNSGGETVLSFSTVLSAKLESLEPAPDLLQRHIRGQLTRVDYVGTILGSAAIQTTDRVSFASALMEVVNVRRWGGEQTILEFSEVR